jgi:hypothetical protein
VVAILVLTLLPAGVAPPHASAAPASTTAGCVASGQLIDSPTCHERLDAAQTRWPDATVSLTGSGSGFGHFIIPGPDGDFQLVKIEGSITPGLASYPSLGSAQATQPAKPQATAYCGQYFTVRIVPSASWWLNHVAFDTINFVQYCYQAWNGAQAPYCWGAGFCQPANTGVNGNHAWTVNNWDDQRVFLWGCCTINAHLRVWVNGYLGINWYAGYYN